MKVTTLYGVLAVLATVRSAAAATYICGATATPASNDVCTCPNGIGVLTPGALSLTGTGTTPAAVTITAATVSGATTLTVGSGVTASVNVLTTAQLLSLCTDVLPGYSAPQATAGVTITAAGSMVAGSAVGAGLVAACASPNYCIGKATAISYSANAGKWTIATAVTAVACPANTASNAAFTSCTINAGYFQGTAISNGVIAAVTQCTQNSYCPGGGDAAAQTAAVPCPGSGTPTTAAAGATAVTSCLTAGGTYVSSFTAASGSTAATASTAACPANSFCPGGVAMTASGVGATACPYVTTQGDATSSAIGTPGTATTITSCVLDAGYYQSAYAAPTATVAVCLANYYCPGGGPVATSGTFPNGATGCPKAGSGGVLGDATTTPYPGTSSNAVSDCYTNPGYYVTANTANGGALCQANEYCPGGVPVPSGTIYASDSTASPRTVGNDGSVSCPTGTTLAAPTSGTAAATGNNDVTDCVIPAGQYVSTIQSSTSTLYASAAACTTAGAPCTAAGLRTVDGALTSCPAGTSCAGGQLNNTAGFGFTSILPNYVVTAVSGIVPTVTACGANVGSNPVTNYLVFAACAGASSSNVLTIGYGGMVSNTDYYVSAPGVVSSCPAAPCTLGQSLATAGGFTIAATYYLGGASGAVTPCPTGATCAGAAFANTGIVAYGATTNSGYYVSTAATSSAVAVVTACPATGATCAGGQSLATQGGITISSGYYASAVNGGVVTTVAACPTGASCAGATGANTLVAGYGATTLAGYWLSGFATSTAAATVSACGTGGGASNVADVCAYGVPLTTQTGGANGIAVAGGAPNDVVSTYYQVNGSSKATAVYTVCPTGATCTSGTGKAGVLYSGAVTASGYFVSAPGTVSQCPTAGATCAVNVLLCTAANVPYAYCTGAAASSSGTPVISLATPGGLWAIYPGYMATSVYNGNAYAFAACPVGAVCAGDSVSNSGSDLPYTGATTAPGYYVSAPGVATACPAGATCTTGQPLSTPGGGVIVAGFYVLTAGSAPALCPTGFYCPGGGNVGIAGGSFQCPANSTLAACNDFMDNAPASYNGGSTSTPVSAGVAAGAVTVSPAAVTVSPAPIVVNFTHSPVFASAAPRAAAHAAVLALAALAALVAF